MISGERYAGERNRPRNMEMDAADEGEEDHEAGFFSSSQDESAERFFILHTLDFTNVLFSQLQQQSHIFIGGARTVQRSTARHWWCHSAAMQSAQSQRFFAQSIAASTC